MHPYRTAPPPPEPARHAGDPVVGLVVLMLALGAIRVVVAIALGEAWSRELVVAWLLIGAGVVVLIRRRRARRWPVLVLDLVQLSVRRRRR